MANPRSASARRSRPLPSLDLERSLWSQGLERVAAVDEVGRGALAGSVVVAAVILPPAVDPGQLAGVRDSKQLSRLQRETLAPQIEQVALAIGIGAATPQEIDRINIRRATALAMARALGRVDPVDHILVDGLPVPELGERQTALVKGDVHCLSIAAASVLAKVTRDGWMRRLDRRFPGYGWQTNVGYGTPQHRQALQELGITRHHRRSFVPLANPGVTC